MPAHLAERVIAGASVLDDPLQLGTSALAEVEMLAEPRERHSDLGGETWQLEAVRELERFVRCGWRVVEQVVRDQGKRVHGQDPRTELGLRRADELESLH